MSSIAILLPLTLKSGGESAPSSLTEGLRQLRESLEDCSSQTRVVIGIDEDDFELNHLIPVILEGFSGLRSTTVKVFAKPELDRRPPGPICWMWDQLANAAMEEADPPDLILLLGVLAI